VVQQHRRPVTAGPAEEREADAAADALLRGRRFDFGTTGFPAAPSGPDRCVVQRYMAWEHCMPDYLAHPEEIENAPEAFLLPLIQSVRSLNIAELRRLAGSGSSGFRFGPRPRLPGSLKYPRLRQLAEIGEVLEVDALGRRCGFARGSCIPLPSGVTPGISPRSPGIAGGPVT
jgi:hypothetical protein